MEFLYKELGKYSFLYFFLFYIFFFITHSQDIHPIYYLIFACKFSIISLKECSFEIFSSTFLIEWRTVE